MDARNLTKENHQTFIWFYNAALKGDPYAQFNLGLLYKQGQGIAKNDVRAFNWMLKAAR